MQKHTKRQVEDNFKKEAFISDVCHRRLCVISDETEMVKEKELSYQLIFSRTPNFPGFPFYFYSARKAYFIKLF